MHGLDWPASRLPPRSARVLSFQDAGMRSSLQLSRVIDRQETEILIQHYADRVLVLVTQLGKVGNLIQASIPPTTQLFSPPLGGTASDPIPLIEPSPSIELTRLLGSAQSDQVGTLQSLYASHIATMIWTQGMQVGGVMDNGDRRSVIVGLALKPSPKSDEGEGLNDATRNTFKGVMKLVLDAIRSGGSNN